MKTRLISVLITSFFSAPIFAEPAVLVGENTQCTSSEIDGAFSVSRYSGGAQPYPGMVIYSEMLRIGDVLSENTAEYLGEKQAQFTFEIESVSGCSKVKKEPS